MFSCGSRIVMVLRGYIPSGAFGPYGPPPLTPLPFYNRTEG